uniref:Uncharacterized protein n=1 Tax=Heterorhabditis bacteriophora TaxID=37862 RepID=A0A1I7X5S9_HETBA
MTELATNADNNSSSKSVTEKKMHKRARRRKMKRELKSELEDSSVSAPSKTYLHKSGEKKEILKSKDNKYLLNWVSLLARKILHPAAEPRTGKISISELMGNNRNQCATRGSQLNSIGNTILQRLGGVTSQQCPIRSVCRSPYGRRSALSPDLLLPWINFSPMFPIDNHGGFCSAFGYPRGAVSLKSANLVIINLFRVKHNTERNYSEQNDFWSINRHESPFWRKFPFSTSTNIAKKWITIGGLSELKIKKTDLEKIIPTVEGHKYNRDAMILIGAQIEVARRDYLASGDANLNSYCQPSSDVQVCFRLCNRSISCNYMFLRYPRLGGSLFDALRIFICLFMWIAIRSGSNCLYFKNVLIIF